MKKLIITIAALMALATTAFATNEVTVTEAGNFHIYYDDVEKGFTDVNGTVVRPIVLEGTTYLPVRAASELVGLSASWNGETSTVTLTAGSGTGCVTTAPAPIAQRAVSATIADNFTIIYNNTKQSFTDANGKTVYPVVKDGTTYLPIRALCSMLNIPVEWNGTTSTIYLGTHTVAPIPAKSVPFNVESTTRYEGDVYTILWTTIDTTGYDYLRIRSTGACYVGVASLEGESLAYKEITEDGVLDVSEYQVVKFRFEDEDASDVQITSLTLEKATTIPEYSIPSGATALTDANTTFDSRENAGDTVYSNGQFIRHNKSPWESIDPIKFQNAGYSTITFTVTTKSMEMRVYVSQPGRPKSTYVLEVRQEANTTKTYTADISSLSTVAVGTGAPGGYCDSIITNMYVK